MSDPKNKAELLGQIREAHWRMERFLATLSEAQLTAAALDEGWSVKDSLAHLVDWEKMMLGWVDSSLRGIPPVRFAPGFVESEGDRVATMLRLNEHLYQQQKGRPPREVLADFRAAHDQVVNALGRPSEADIFDPARFPWRKGSPLLDVIGGNTYEHFDEHLGWMRKGLGLPEEQAATAPERLTSQAVAESLQSTLSMLRAEYASLPEAALRWRPAEGEWCANEVVGHLIESEQRGFAGRIQTILSGPEPKLGGWDQTQIASGRHDCERDPKALLDEFSRLREQSIAQVRALKPDDLRRGGYHDFIGYVTVGELLAEWVHHDRNHFRQLLANVQAYVWPNMGSTQRFSLPH